MIMPLELTEQQRQAIEAQGGQPVEVVDPATNRAYLVIAKETFASLQAAVAGTPAALVEQPCTPPGVKRSRAAFLRDLPELLQNPKHDRWFALYHGDSCVRIARRYEDLLRECRRRGLQREAYYIGIIRPHEPEPEEIEHTPAEYDDAITPSQP
jgi:hypothetical protein